MATDDDIDDPVIDDPVKVKELLEWAARKTVGVPVGDAPKIDEQTRAQLEAWFGLPSFQQVAEEEAAKPRPAAEVDAEQQALLERRAKALAAVDAAWLDRHDAKIARYNRTPMFMPDIDVGNGLAIKLDTTLLDEDMIAKVGSIADPREVEIPEQLQDDLRDCTPQALLRDLHRPVFDFYKNFDRTDFMEEHRVDLVAIVEGAMSEHYRLELRPEATFTEGVRLVREAAALRRVASDDIPRRTPPR